MTEEHARLELPPAARPAVEIAKALVDAGHQALLAGGCVRDLLLGQEPEDYDIATSARPEEIARLLRPTRQVGAQFGVMLVKRGGRWFEVATFRRDGPYLDGRRPVRVHLSDARHDAERRDFTINGMFLDPLRLEVVDYVGGRADLAARLIRAIGDPRARFAEDYLRLLRAVRFAARLRFEIEPQTLAAIREGAPRLAQVAAERVQDELERMLARPSRADAWRWLATCGLLPYLWPAAAWDNPQIEQIRARLALLPPDAPLEAAMSLMLADEPLDRIEQIAQDLAMSNDRRDALVWLGANRAALDDPGRPTKAEFKRLLAHPAFPLLHLLARVRFAEMPDGAERAAALDRRVAGVPPEAIAPPPLVTGEDLLARSVAPGPIYRRVLDTLYTRQLEEELTTRDQALAELDALLAALARSPAAGEK